MTDSNFDPIATEIIRHGLIATTEEMKINLTRTAYNIIIYEHLDFTVGLFDANGATISIGLGLPSFIRGMSETVKANIKAFGYSGMRPGDVLVTNDPWVTGSHKNHITLTLPIFANGRIVAFAACMAHWQDIGGALHTVTTDIFAEGLELPITKLYDAGEECQQVTSLLARNVRSPEKALGDLKAQLSAVKTGEKRFGELIDRFGLPVVLSSMEAIMGQSESLARESVAKIPDGDYEAESFMDDDAVDIGRRIPLRVRVSVHGDLMTIDLSEISPQVRGFYNSGETTGRGCAQVAFKCLTSATDLPINDGAFRNLKINLPEGTVVSATRPAAMRYWMTVPMTIVDTIIKALSSAIPERVAAGHHADLMLAQVTGTHPRSDRNFYYSAGMIGGGWGAKRGEDGMSATVCMNDGDTHNGPVEQLESKFPFLVEEYSLRVDSGGAGRHRGGLGTVYVCNALTDITFTSVVERVHCRPWGLEGGKDGLGNFVALRRNGIEETKFPNGKIRGAQLKKGDAFILKSGGGGGFGDPLERPISAVLDDVREGYVSAESAKLLYAVVVDPMTSDEAATAGDRQGTKQLTDKKSFSESKTDNL